MKLQSIGLGALLVVSLNGACADDIAPQAVPPPQPQSAVKTWLQLQSSGKAASSQRQPLSGAAMEKIHERYIKSFATPIPPTYERADNFGK